MNHAFSSWIRLVSSNKSNIIKDNTVVPPGICPWNNKHTPCTICFLRLPFPFPLHRNQPPTTPLSPTHIPRYLFRFHPLAGACQYRMTDRQILVAYSMINSELLGLSYGGILYWMTEYILSHVIRLQRHSKNWSLDHALPLQATYNTSSTSSSSSSSFIRS